MAQGNNPNEGWSQHENPEVVLPQTPAEKATEIKRKLSDLCEGKNLTRHVTTEFNMPKNKDGTVDYENMKPIPRIEMRPADANSGQVSTDVSSYVDSVNAELAQTPELHEKVLSEKEYLTMGVELCKKKIQVIKTNLPIWEKRLPVVKVEIEKVKKQQKQGLTMDNITDELSQFDQNRSESFDRESNELIEEPKPNKLEE